MNIRTYSFSVLLVALLPFAVCSELDELVKEGQGINPSVQAAKYRMEQMLLKHYELSEFFDPSLFAALGRADTARNLPLQTGYTSLTNNSTELQAGVEVSVEPGAYVSAGAAQRILEDEEGYGDLYQTMFGVKVRIPLLRDRGFKDLSLKKAMAMAEYNAATGAMLGATQSVRHTIELAYISAYENLSSYRIAQEATKRFQNLHNEAIELSKMKVVPDFQTFQTKMDLQVGLEDEENARIKFEESLLVLAKAIGVTRNLALKGNPDEMFAIQKVEDLQEVAKEAAFEARGEYIQCKANLQYARTQVESADEEQNDSLDLNFGITAQGEHETHPFGMEKLVTDRRVGGEVTLVWKRSLDYRGANTRRARYEARIKEVQELLKEIEIGISNEIATARLNYKAAMKRLDLVSQGIEAAKQNLAAEQERFRLGETTSSIVTDAQKNLTTILRRQASAAADLMRARANFNYATGYREDSNTKETKVKE
ncbi:MAG: TolC family protein [Victivallales bacterium]|nr:TolC family protein [Victivallales bacterium]